MTVKSIFTFGIFACFFTLLNAQEYRDSPKCPKGDEASQRKALVHYNEAVGIYKEQKIAETKKALRTAVNTSFALVEAQLFLADVLYNEGVRDSALYFYKSGLDFIIHQEPRYYFRLFELGMEFEQYDVVKQYLKYFKKVHGEKKHGVLYEEGYPYTIADYMLYKESIDLVYDFKSWKTEWKLKGVAQDEEWPASSAKFENGVLFLEALKAEIDFSILQSDTLEILDPYYLSEEALLYFSSKTKRGDLDLFVAKVDVEGKRLIEVRSLDRINTLKDERSPTFHGGLFFFSSNGYPGFGGMDLYQTPDMERIHGFLLPMNHYNMKAGINSGKDEVKIAVSADSIVYVLKNSIYPKRNEIQTFKNVPLEKSLNYEISLQ